VPSIQLDTDQRTRSGVENPKDAACVVRGEAPSRFGGRRIAYNQEPWPFEQQLRRSRSWEQKWFLEVDTQAGCSGEVVKNLLQGKHGRNISFGEDQRIVCVLQHKTREGVIHRVAEDTVRRSTLDELLKNIRDNDEEVW